MRPPRIIRRWLRENPEHLLLVGIATLFIIGALALITVIWGVFG